MLAVVESDENTSSESDEEVKREKKGAVKRPIEASIGLPNSENPMDQGPRKASGSGRKQSQEVQSSPIMAPDDSSNKETKSTESKEVKSQIPKSLESLPYLEESKKGSDVDIKSAPR